MPLAMENGDCFVKTMADIAPAMMPSVQQRFLESAKRVIFGTTLNVLLLCIPMAILCKQQGIGHVRRI